MLLGRKSVAEPHKLPSLWVVYRDIYERLGYPSQGLPRRADESQRPPRVLTRQDRLSPTPGCQRRWPLRVAFV
jgi:hypothetical protein